MQSIKEKGAFLCVITAINNIISCPPLRDIIFTFLETKPYTEYAMSNERLFYWTFLLREEYCNAIGKQPPSLETLNEYYNPQKLTKDVWGPYHWRMMHQTAIRVRTQDGVVPQPLRTTVKAFITCLGLLLPCPSCKSHAHQYFTTHAIDPFLDTNFHIFQWTVDFHNEVNQRLNSESGTQKKIFSYEEALRIYTDVPDGMNLSEKWMK
jgi:hypothetical protein